MFKRSINQDLILYNDIEVIFGFFAIINYPVFYFLFNDNIVFLSADFIIRMLATIFCVPLILKKYWPITLSKYFRSYWLTTVTFCIPFFGTYFALANSFSKGWESNILLGVFWLILVLEWTEFVFSLILGIVAAIILHNFIAGNINISGSILNIHLINILWVIITSGIFLIKKESVNNEKLNALRSINSQIAHELRTPLSAISLNIDSIQFLTQQINSKNKKSLLSEIDEHTKHTLKILKNTFVLIDINLTKIKPLKQSSFHNEHILKCIDEAINSYPNQSIQGKIIMHDPKDFQFNGDKVQIIHVLYNLLQNALFAIESKQKGKIYFSTKIEDQYNILVFQDTASGISKEIFPKLFQRFTTNKKFGTGLGLHFCKTAMEAMGGNISCKSVQGEYTEFTLKFPKVQGKDNNISI